MIKALEEYYDEAVRCARLSIEAAGADPESIDMSKTRLCQLLGDVNIRVVIGATIEGSVLLAGDVIQVMSDSSPKKPLRLYMLATRLADHYLNSQKPNLEWLDEANSLWIKL